MIIKSIENQKPFVVLSITSDTLPVHMILLILLRELIVAYIMQVCLYDYVPSYFRSVHTSCTNWQSHQELTKPTNELLSYTMGLLKKRSHGYFRNVKSVQQIKPLGSRQVLFQLLVNDA